MSCKIDRNFLTRQEILQIKDDLFIEGEPSDYGPAETIDAWGENSESLYIPFNYYKNKFEKIPNKEIKFQKTNFKFTGTFKNEDQKKVYKEAISQLKQKKSTFLSLRTGFGKTFLAIHLSSTAKLKTGILVHRSILSDQWAESIKKFTEAKVQVIDSKTIFDPEADYYIFNIAYVSKNWDTETKKWKRKKFSDLLLKSIGVLVVDEAHICGASEMSKALQYFEPKFLIGLSATPTRKDGLDKILDLYFGEEKIIRISDDPFTVYKINTGIKPEFTNNVHGKKNWGSVINYLSNSEKRNNMIVDIVKNNPNEIFMILCKLKVHCDILSKKLEEIGENVTVMVGSKKVYDKTARILISTTSKLGVGFDDSRLTSLILAMDLIEVEQYAGRVRDSAGSNKKIFDLVDEKDFSCLSHWRQRRKWYLSRNGTIITLKKEEEPEPVRKRFAPKNLN